MLFFAWFVVLGGFVDAQTLNPRSVNVAVETVLEFDGKHNGRDLKAINKLQNYLNRIKKILSNNDDSRRSLPRGLKFRDFLKSTLQTVASYDDNDLQDVVAIANNEIRKYHYKGCRFHELVDNPNMRRDMAQKLVTLNDLTAKELRATINKAAKVLEADTMTEEKKKILDYLDSMFVGDAIKNKMGLLVSQLEQFKKRSKRSNVNLDKVINQGLRSIIFDYYTNLNVNARKELKVRLEEFWVDFKNSYTVKDVWKKSLTTKAFRVHINDFEMVYPKRNSFRSKSNKKTKKHKMHGEPIQKPDMRKLRRARPEYPKKEMPKIQLRKKTDRFKKYEKKDKLRTLQPTTPFSGEDVSIDRRGSATATDSIDLEKSRKRSKKNRKRVKAGQHKRKHQYITIEPMMMMYYKHTRRSNDYGDDSDEPLRIQSFETQKTTNSLRRSFVDSLCNDTTVNTVESTAPTPNVLYKIDKIEKTLYEIKNLVSSRRKDNEVHEEKINTPKPTVSIAKETESTVSTSQTTKITLPVTETTTQKITTEESKIKPTTVEELRNKLQTTKPTKLPESVEEEMDVSIEVDKKSFKTLPENKTESTFTTKEITSQNPEFVSTVKTTLELVTNNTRRSNQENVQNKTRFVREAKVSNLGDLDNDILKTKRSNNNFKDMIKDKLKSIKAHDLTEKDREEKQRKYNEYHLTDKFKGFDTEKIGKYHEFPDIKRSKEQDFDDFVSDNTKSEKEDGFPVMEGIQTRRSNKNVTDFDKEEIEFGKDHNPLNVHNLNDDIKYFKHDKVKLDKSGEWKDIEDHTKNHLKDFAMNTKYIVKDHDIADAQRLSEHNLNDELKHFDSEAMKFGKLGDFAEMEHHFKDSFKDLDKDKLEFGKGIGLADIARMHKQHLHKLKETEGGGGDKIKIGKENLTDHDVESMYESHRASKDKEEHGLTDLDIEHMYNETRRAQLHKMLDKNSEKDRDLHKRVSERIAGHMQNVLGMEKDEKVPNKFDFNIDDPFSLKEDESVM